MSDKIQTLDDRIRARAQAKFDAWWKEKWGPIQAELGMGGWSMPLTIKNDRNISVPGIITVSELSLDLRKITSERYLPGLIKAEYDEFEKLVERIKEFT